METKNLKSNIKHLIKDIKEKREAMMAFIYSISYFVFITLLLVFGSTARAQGISNRPGEAKSTKAIVKESPREVNGALYKAQSEVDVSGR
jgi:hypothetical protein